MGASKLLLRIRHIITLTEDALLVLLLTGMILLAFTQIVLRNLADIGINWGDPMLRILVLWLALAGAIAATRDDNHIHIDILSRLLPKSIGDVFKRLTNLFSAVVCGIIAWYSFQFVLMEQQDGLIAFSNIPAWILELILPIGFGIIALHFLINSLVSTPREHTG